MGLTSTDIGVEETSETTVGTSLQLTGVGTSYEDFTWTAGATQSFGTVNAGMSFGGLCTAPSPAPIPAPAPAPVNGSVANVFISELHYDNVRADIGKR